MEIYGHIGTYWSDLQDCQYGALPSGFISHMAGWKIPYQWRFTAGKIVHQWWIFHHAMFDYQMVKMMDFRRWVEILLGRSLPHEGMKLLGHFRGLVVVPAIIC